MEQILIKKHTPEGNFRTRHSFTLQMGETRETAETNAEALCRKLNAFIRKTYPDLADNYYYWEYKGPVVEEKEPTSGVEQLFYVYDGTGRTLLVTKDSRQAMGLVFSNEDYTVHQAI